MPRRLSHTSLHHNVTIKSKLISFFNFLRNYSRRQHLQNEGNRTSKKLRSRQIETKSLMGKGVFSSLVFTSKSEYLWINKVWIKFPSRRNAQMIIVINKYVESWKSWKLFGGKRKSRDWKMIRLTRKVNFICEEAVAVFLFDLGRRRCFPLWFDKLIFLIRYHVLLWLHNWAFNSCYSLFLECIC